ncbi:Uu.00g029920.m01.CDS01 [Anthostomella pinea]|uniref:Uu.00g029920.m01.CDS01 n=1 Tax=Anthostomella pinea TaxID=933095 RepID=A0AAI8V825_9PEZI|nr:Uu.00g029920.m01.CDS01 [Anthostomella pinea]
MGGTIALLRRLCFATLGQHLPHPFAHIKPALIQLLASGIHKQLIQVVDYSHQYHAIMHPTTKLYTVAFMALATAKVRDQGGFKATCKDLELIPQDEGQLDLKANCFKVPFQRRHSCHDLNLCYGNNCGKLVEKDG